ncbi:MAG: hypothetical protein KZQ83_14950 [gamma proteobacterium symbiont of Taylorina sp.]|nr:hypothetical protein [gamma proteobacterium symbiont of Taylorina sp.]
MGFNSNKFMKQGFEHRTDSVSVPSLAEWFDKDSTPEFLVRNLTGTEMSNAQEAAAKNKNVAAIAEALVSSSHPDKVAALKDFVGTGDKVPNELAKRMEMMVSGTVEPEVDMSMTIKIAENFPVEFMQITNKITMLTGLGASTSKPKPSGKIQPSEAV